MTSSRDMKRQSITELVGGANSLVRQGIKLGGKKGGRAVQQGQSAAIKAGQGAKVKASQGNQSKMVGSGKYEKAGAMVGGVAGGIAGGVLDGPLPVGDIVGGIAGSKIGGKIGRQFDKRANTKTEQYTFEDFMEAKALDPALAGAASIRQTGAGGRKYPERKKSEGERTRVKAVGGGKTAPAASYKDRKDIGDTKARSNVEQQPTRERGTAGLSAKEQQRKAYRERKARESGGSTAPKKKEAEKTATELLKKKTTKAVAPGYKPQQASGMTRAERDKRRGEGERMLKGIMKDQETDKYKKETGTNPDAKGRTKILGRVNKRMST